MLGERGGNFAAEGRQLVYVWVLADPPASCSLHTSGVTVEGQASDVTGHLCARCTRPRVQSASAGRRGRGLAHS